METGWAIDSSNQRLIIKLPKDPALQEEIEIILTNKIVTDTFDEHSNSGN